MDTQTTTSVSEHYLAVAKDLLANGNSTLAQRLLQMAVGGGDPGETATADKPAAKRGKPNRSGGNHPLAEKARAWVETQRAVTTPSLIAHFSSLKSEGGQYQANKLLQWLESEGVVSPGNKRAGRLVLANVTAEEIAEGRPSVPATPKTLKVPKVKAKKPAKIAKPKKGERIRRTNDEIQEAADKFCQVVKDNPGQRMEQLRELLGMSAHELMKPVATLLQQDLIRTVGNKRGTAYFATLDEDDTTATSIEPTKKASSTKRTATKKAISAKKDPAPELSEDVVDAEFVDVKALAAIGGVEVVAPVTPEVATSVEPMPASETV